MSEKTKLGMLPVCIVLSFLGTVANVASLVYFIKKGKKSIGDKLLMLLNSLDLLMCFMAAILSFMILIDHGIFFVMIVYLLVLDGTSYTTCLLSVTRAIGIANPFYKIRGKLLVIVGIFVYIAMELSAHLIPFLIFALAGKGDYIQNEVIRAKIVMTSIIILMVLCATVVSVYKLTRNGISEGTEGTTGNNERASWTVVILSTLFFVFNVIVIVLSIILISEFAKETKSTVATNLQYVGVLLLAPLNSTINPIIYFIRRSDMREFFAKSFRKMCS